MKKTLYLSLCLLTLLTACAKEEPGTLRLGTMPTYSGAIYAVGIEQGFFEDAGVNVSLTVFRSARDRDGAVAAGQLDGFMTDIMGAVNLNAKDFPVIMTSREYEDFGIMAGPLTDMNATKPTSIGISENTVVDYITDTYGQEGLEKVNMVALPDRLGALLAGELNLGVFPQPFMGIIMASGGEAVVTTASQDFHPVVLAFDENYLEANGPWVKAFYEGYAKTVAYMQENDYSVYKDALVKHGLATEETVDNYRIPVDSYGLNSVTEKDYNAITQWMVNKALIQTVPAYEKVTNKTYVE